MGLDPPISKPRRTKMQFWNSKKFIYRAAHWILRVPYVYGLKMQWMRNCWKDNLNFQGNANKNFIFLIFPPQQKFWVILLDLNFMLHKNTSSSLGENFSLQHFLQIWSSARERKQKNSKKDTGSVKRQKLKFKKTKKLSKAHKLCKYVKELRCKFGTSGGENAMFAISSTKRRKKIFSAEEGRGCARPPPPNIRRGVPQPHHFEVRG